jgi:hypothetical protein
MTTISSQTYRQIHDGHYAGFSEEENQAIQNAKGRDDEYKRHPTYGDRKLEKIDDTFDNEIEAHPDNAQLKVDKADYDRVAHPLAALRKDKFPNEGQENDPASGFYKYFTTPMNTYIAADLHAERSALISVYKRKATAKKWQNIDQAFKLALRQNPDTQELKTAFEKAQPQIRKLSNP